jgi:crotonobetainyl-CoA:carnitine CoA-transferase CaiB-like acyl-CoA transferase
MLLVDMGADVIKIEPPSGDIGRRAPLHRRRGRRVSGAQSQQARPCHRLED